MNRIPLLACLVFLIWLVVRYLPRFWKKSSKLFRYGAFPLCVFVILYLTIFSRFIASTELYNRIFNMGYTETQQVVTGNRGSEWLAGKQGVTGFRLFLIGLSDPNSRLYLIPSCLMNLLLFMPLGMLFPFTGFYQRGNKSNRFWILLCAGFVLCIELVQLLSGLGQFDVLDILFNTAGFAAGLKLAQPKQPDDSSLSGSKGF